MSVPATITLERLVCFEESDQGNTSHSEPYLWSWLGTLNGGQFSATPTTAREADTRRVIKNEMRANQSAYLPLDGANKLETQFDDGMTIRHLFIVVALLEADFDIPTGAMRAGYQAFLNELTVQFKANLGPLLLAQDDPDALKVIIDKMKKAVKDKAFGAVKNALGTLDTLEGVFGFLDKDDYINADFWHFEHKQMRPSQFTLGFRGNSGDPRIIPGSRFSMGQIKEFPVSYALDCRLETPDLTLDHAPLGGGGVFSPAVG